MNTHEVRIGNIVSVPEKADPSNLKPRRVTGILRNGEFDFTTDNEKPIICKASHCLGAEISINKLIEFGFTNNPGEKLFFNSGVFIYYNESNNFWHLSMDKDFHCEYRLLFIHQLQNFWFLLKGNDLAI